MWLIPYNKGEDHLITIEFKRMHYISGIKFYNYNKSEEDSLRGVKQITIKVDGKFVTQKKGVTLRKAPGLVHNMFDMGQFISIPYQKGWTADDIIPLKRKIESMGIFQEYEPMHLPSGFLFRFNLHSTHGDFYYIGLNGIEFYDQHGQVVQIKNIFAQPEGVYKLPGMQDDQRTVDKLINGINETYIDTNMWLAPFKNTKSSAAAQEQKNQQGMSSRIPNYIYITFNEPQVISAIKIWNYSKTPQRGVNEFELLIDDQQVYRGFVKQAPEKHEYDTSFNKDFSTVILFNSDSKIVEKYKNNINFQVGKEQNVILVNEKKVVNKNQVKKRLEQQFIFSEDQRPQTIAKHNY